MELAYPAMLAFNAVNHLFGVGTFSMMSRSLGRGNREMVCTRSAFGFCGAVFSGLVYVLFLTEVIPAAAIVMLVRIFKEKT